MDKQDVENDKTFSNFMTINTKKIRIQPMEEDTGHENKKIVTEKVVTEKKPLEYGLKYIEFVGNFVILFFMLTFISIYWCIGLVYMYFYT